MIVQLKISQYQLGVYIWKPVCKKKNANDLITWMRWRAFFYDTKSKPKYPGNTIENDIYNYKPYTNTFPNSTMAVFEKKLDADDKIPKIF